MPILKFDAFYGLRIPCVSLAYPLRIPCCLERLFERDEMKNNLNK